MRHKGKTKTAEILKETFWKLYSEKGMDKIKISEITDAAGYNRGVFYSYYKNIYEIYDIIERETMSKIKEMSQLIQSYILDDYSNSKLIAIFDIYTKNEKYLRVLFTKDDNPRFMMRMKKMLKENLINEHKKFKHSLSINTEYYIEFYIAGMLNVIMYWCISSNRLSIDDFAKLMTELIQTKPVDILKQIYCKN